MTNLQQDWERSAIIVLIVATKLGVVTMTIVSNDAGLQARAPILLGLSGISWSAVIAGAAVICALTLFLLALGIGLGMSVVSPWGNSGVSATTFKIGSGLFFVVIAMISGGLGGHITGRLRRRYTGMHDNEVYFRDTANGFVTWAVATIIGAAVLSSAANTVVGGVLTGASDGAASATQVAGNSSPTAGYVDRLLRPDPSATAANAAAANQADPRDELIRIVTPALRNNGSLKPDDRTYIAQVVSRRTGLSQADAEKRIDDVTNQIKSDLETARKAALHLSLWLAASMLFGAFAAAIAAAEGGAIRDRNWGNATDY